MYFYRGFDVVTFIGNLQPPYIIRYYRIPYNKTKILTNFSTKKCRLYAGCETFFRLIYVNKLSKTREIQG